MRPTPLNALMQLINQNHPSKVPVYGAAIDSRLVKSGDLFFAMKGERLDGHHFLETVAKKQAAAAVVDCSYSGPSYGLPLIPVPDVRLALQELAHAFLKQQNMKVVAITGSIGKTTTKEFAKIFIGSSYSLFATPLNYNSQLTVPLNILSIRGDEEILLLEMGMSQPGDIARLIEIAPPDIALITTVAPQHADTFADGLEGIAKEKGSIFSHQNTKLGIYFHNMPYSNLVRTIGGCEKKTFCTSQENADFFIQRQGEQVTIYEKNKPSFTCHLSLPMKVYDLNFLAAWSLARNLNIPAEILGTLAPFLKLPPMRFERIEKNGKVVINDAYNASPDGMIAAFESLPIPQKQGRKIAIISEMRVLGTYSDISHRQVAHAALKHVDHLLCIGDHCRIIQDIWHQEGRSCEFFSSFESLAQRVSEYVRPDDVVLLKGARFYALERLIESL